MSKFTPLCTLSPILAAATTVRDMTSSLTFVPEIDHLENPRATQAVKLLADATLIHTTVAPMDNNCWFVVSPSGDALLIDAAGDAEHLLDIASEANIRITDVLTTHQHDDHVQALEAVLKATSARHHAGRTDAPGLPVAADETYGTDDGQSELLRQAGDFQVMDLHVVELRGHTPGGIAVLANNETYFQPPRAFVGDSLFPGGVGKTENPEDFQQLIDDVEQRILNQPEETIVHPGHGDSTTVGEELPQVDEWRQRGW